MVDVVTNWTPNQPNNQSGPKKSSSSSSSSSNNNIKMSPIHPLENEWVFWYDKRQLPGKRVKGEKEMYESNLRPLGSFNTVEDFWRYYNHMVKPSKMDNNANYHLFKKDVKPMWEDTANVKGGKWILTVKGGDKSLLDQYWENLVLALVGETLDVNDDITGAVVSRRKAGDRAAIWTRNRDDEESILTIGKRIRTVVGIPESVPLHYQSHEDSMRTGASYTNPPKYSI